MLSRSDFSTPQWQDLQTSIFGTARYISLSQGNGLFGDIKEMHAVEEIIKKRQVDNPNNFILDITKYYLAPDFPKGFEQNPDSIEAHLFHAISNTVQVLLGKDSATLDYYQQLILEVAAGVAKEIDDVSYGESMRYAKLIQVLTPKPPEED